MNKKIMTLGILGILLFSGLEFISADGGNDGRVCYIEGNTQFMRHMVQRILNADLPLEQRIQLFQRFREFIADHRVCRPLPGNPNL